MTRPPPLCSKSGCRSGNEGALAMRIGFGFLLGGIVLALAIVDARKHLLPDRLNLLLAAIGAGQPLILGAPSAADAALGGLFGALSLLLIAALFRRWRGVDGLGLGDVKLVAAAGIW